VRQPRGHPRRARLSAPDAAPREASGLAAGASAVEQRGAVPDLATGGGVAAADREKLRRVDERRGAHRWPDRSTRDRGGVEEVAGEGAGLDHVGGGPARLAVGRPRRRRRPAGVALPRQRSPTRPNRVTRLALMARSYPGAAPPLSGARRMQSWRVSLAGGHSKGLAHSGDSGSAPHASSFAHDSGQVSRIQTPLESHSPSVPQYQQLPSCEQSSGGAEELTGPLSLNSSSMGSGGADGCATPARGSPPCPRSG